MSLRPVIPPEFREALRGVAIRKRGQPVACGHINPGYVEDKLADEHVERWFFVHRGRTVGFLAFEVGGCAGAGRSKHVLLHLICAAPDSGIHRLGTHMLFTLLLAAKRAGMAWVYLEAAGRQTFRSNTVQEQRLLCWYEAMGFRPHDSRCDADETQGDYRIYRKGLRESPAKLLAGMNSRIVLRRQCEPRTPHLTVRQMRQVLSGYVPDLYLLRRPQLEQLLRSGIGRRALAENPLPRAEAAPPRRSTRLNPK